MTSRKNNGYKRLQTTTNNNIYGGIVMIVVYKVVANFDLYVIITYMFACNIPNVEPFVAVNGAAKKVTIYFIKILKY